MKRLFLIISLVGLMLVTNSALAADYFFYLPKGIKIGEISGPGHEQLSRALKKRVSQGPTDLILSGRVQLRQNSQKERELVPLPKDSGEPYDDYLPDPFTGRIWRQEVQPTVTTLDAFDLERYLGLMTLKWSLSVAGGSEVVEAGQVVLDINRTRGGYLAQEGMVPDLSSAQGTDQKFESRLADDLVRLLALNLGRGAKVSELETGKDKWSRRAKSLAGSGDWDGAKKEWETLLEMNPKYGPALYNLGIYWERARNPEEALRYYRSAFVNDASVRHREALTRLTETLSRAGRLPQRTSQDDL